MKAKFINSRFFKVLTFIATVYVITSSACDAYTAFVAQKHLLFFMEALFLVCFSYILFQELKCLKKK